MPSSLRSSPWFPALLVLSLAPLLTAAPAAAEPYRLDPVHTRIVFVVDHAGLSRAMGVFSGVEGNLEFDPEHWADARVELAIPLASLELGDAGWQSKVLGGAFLYAGKHPLARFVSTAVEPVDGNRARITGDLTLHGVTRPVVLDARLNAVKRHPITHRRSVGFSATATLRRRDFGIVEWPNVIGDDIELMIEVEGIRDAAANAPANPEPNDDAADPQHR